MEDVLTIDGFKKLKPEQFTKFCSTLSSDDEEITISYVHTATSEEPKTLTCTKANLIEVVFSQEIVNYCSDDDDIILVQNAKCILQLAGIDVKWWLENNRRMNKMIAAVHVDGQQPAKDIAKPVVNKRAEYSVALADLTEEGFINVDKFTGTKAECIKFLNTAIIKHSKSDGTVDALFNLHFAEEDLTLNNLKKWKTLHELIEEGKVK